MIIKTFLFFCTTILLILTHELAHANINYLCNDDRVTCQRVEQGDTWYDLFPDPQQRALVMRINRQNTRLHPGEIIAVPKDLNNATLMEFSPFAYDIEATGRQVVMVSPRLLAWGAYDESGHLVSWGPISAGSNWCRDIGHSCRTPAGSFTVYNEGSAACVSSKYPLGEGGAPMPYCMFFNGGYALHGSSFVPGGNASHGCVRMFTEDAQWLNEDFVTVGTQVVVMAY